MVTLQGLPTRVWQSLLESTEGNEAAVGKAIGDAMSINVLMRLLPRALYSVGLTDGTQDVWAAAEDAIALSGDFWR